MTLNDQRQRPPRIGTLPAGRRNAITDIAGVTVGHVTLADGPRQTGVTVIRPHDGDPYRDRVPAAASVINGFGKSIGLMQIAELGTLETPITLSNTFAVGRLAEAQIKAAIAANPGCGRRLPTVNPLVLECNDGYLNDLQALAIEERHYHAALAAAGPEVEEGAVGAGRGMAGFGVKAGIGTASRRIDLGKGATYHIGALVLANFGRTAQLTIAGRTIGPMLAERLATLTEPPEQGSIIMVLATDAPLDARQLGRLSLRAAAGLARTGSVFGHGSGDIALAFSTAYTLPQDPAAAMPALTLLHDGRLDPLFQGAADAVEQAIIHALWRAETVIGRDGHYRRSLLTVVPELRALYQEQMV